MADDFLTILREFGIDILVIVWVMWRLENKLEKVVDGIDSMRDTIGELKTTILVRKAIDER